jgi:hypothetical protein
MIYKFLNPDNPIEIPFSPAEDGFKELYLPKENEKQEKYGYVQLEENGLPLFTKHFNFDLIQVEQPEDYPGSQQSIITGRIDKFIFLSI